MQADKIYAYTANAKINLGLTVGEKRPDGYHRIETLMQSVSLYDILYFSKSAELSVRCKGADIPQGKDNIVYKALCALGKYSGQALPLKVEIEKNIPSMAGLGGASADAAAALIAANELFALKLSYSELSEISASIGSDVPFMLTGGLARCTGRGEVVSSIMPALNADIVLIKPERSVSTKTAYDFFDNNRVIHYENDFSAALRMLNEGKPESLSKVLGNDFEKASLKQNADTATAKKSLLCCGALYASLSGSGSAVYGIFDNSEKAQKAKQILSKQYHFCAAVRCCNSAVKLI